MAGIVPLPTDQSGCMGGSAVDPENSTRSRESLHRSLYGGGSA
jgi:hypothetical protein